MSTIQHYSIQISSLIKGGRPNKHSDNGKQDW